MAGHGLQGPYAAFLEIKRQSIDIIDEISAIIFCQHQSDQSMCPCGGPDMAQSVALRCAAGALTVP